MANNVRIIVGTSVLAESDGVTVNNIRWSYDGPRTMTFTRDIRFDTDTLINLNDEVMCVINNVTMFNGWIIDIKPNLEDNEIVTYECGDSRVKLAKITLKKDDSASVIYNEGNEGPMTYGEIFYDIVTISGLIPDDVIANLNESEIKAMNIVSPEMSFTAISVDEALRMITDKAGKFGFYITPNKALKVVNLEALTAKIVYVGQIGETIENHPEYDVWRANLNFSVAGVYTIVTIEGARKKYQETVNLIPAWNRYYEEFWATGSNWWQTTGQSVPQEELTKVYRLYTIPRQMDEIQIGRIDTESGTLMEVSYTAPAGWYPDTTDKWFPVDGQVSTDAVNGQGKVLFPAPLYQWIRQTTIDTGSPNILSAIIEKRVAGDVRAYMIREGEAFKITVGPSGTAYTKYGVVNELYIYDENFAWENVAREGADGKRDDTSMMTDIANQLLDIYSDEQTTGTITLDTLRLDWDLGLSANINNTSKAGWESLGATVITVEINPADEITALTLSSSQYVGGAPDYEELKRRILIGQKIQEIESDIIDLQNKTQYLGIGGNSMTMNSSGDTPESNLTWDGAAIRKEIQNAMNEGYFTIQKHDHTTNTQGGPAFAQKGGYLL